MGQESVEQHGLKEALQRTAVAMTSKSKHVYSKEFLLSVAELEECKRAPVDLESFFQRETQPRLEEKGLTLPELASSRGLNRTGREFDVCSKSPPDVPEWRRSFSQPGSPFLKSGPRHTELKISSPRSGPAQANNNLTRSIMGRSVSARWELHSNGDDRDGEGNHNLSEWESSSATESGSRFRKKGLARSGSVVSQEHDGLLGSGGPIVQRGMLQTHVNDRHRPERTSRIGRTGDQYHSTLSGKMSRNHSAIPNLVWEDADSMSHETFGSDDQPNGERSKQERQRRDQFEQMRNELRKKPLKLAGNHKDAWLGEGLQSAESFFPSSPGTPHSTSCKLDAQKSFNKPVSTSSTPRLLVPPGFSKPMIAKEDHELGKLGKDSGTDPLKKTSSNDGADLDREDHNGFVDENQKASSSSDSPMTSKFARWFPSQVPGLDAKDSLLNSGPLSIVTKFQELDFSIDSPAAKSELAGSSENRLMSKLSVTSLIPSNSRGSVLPMPAGPSLEDVEKMMTAEADSEQDLMLELDLNRKNYAMQSDHHALSDSNQAAMNDTAEYPQILDSGGAVIKHTTGNKNSPLFLKCEDLEQSILTESVHSDNQTIIEGKQQDRDNDVDLIQLLQIGSSERENKEKDKGWDVAEQQGSLNGRASVDIMSLLQKTSGKDSPLGRTVSTTSEPLPEHLIGQKSHLEDQCGTSDIISLETLFGKTFVNELQSVKEPVSAKQIMDDSTHVGKDDSLQTAVFPNNSHPRRASQADVEFHEEVGWKHKGHVVGESEGPEAGSTFQYLQENHLTEALVNHHSSVNATKNSHSSRGVSGNDASFSHFRNRNVSYHPYQAHGQQREVHPNSGGLPHRLHLSPFQQAHRIRGSSIHPMGMYTPSNLVYREFPGAGNSHLPDYFGEGSPVFRGAYRLPSSVSMGYPESIQMGFNANHGIPDPRINIARIRPMVNKWFPEDQAIPAFHSYQPLMTHERKPGPGIPGLGIVPGAQSYNLALPSESLVQPEISYDQHTISNARPGYG